MTVSCLSPFFMGVNIMLEAKSFRQESTPDDGYLSSREANKIGWLYCCFTSTVNI